MSTVVLYQHVSRSHRKPFDAAPSLIRRFVYTWPLLFLFLLTPLSSTSLMYCLPDVCTARSVPPTVSLDEPGEFCQWETFEASCDGTPSDAEYRVIVMRSARYGLMKVGRCVAKNYGFVGCSTDVLGHLDSLCSGKRRCRVAVPDETLRAMQPCPKDFSPYLEAAYQCVSGETSVTV